MANTPFGPSSREQKLEEVLAAYLQAVEAGQAPDREELLRRHPDLASELASFFANQEQFAQLAEPVQPVAFSPHGREAPQEKPEPSNLQMVRSFPVPQPEPSPTVSGADLPAIPGYEILEQLGRGGMGVVYRARQVRLNRIVALKMIRAGQLTSAAELQRFQREAEAVAELEHPHIVPIYEIGEHAGHPYFSMKLVEGGSLVQHLARLRKDLRAAAQLLATIARAVHHMHQHGILHRDLKPANILLDSQGQPYVADFGLAKRIDGDTCLTQSGVIVGTPSYMAPEQAGARKGLSTAVDVYSLGAILYELLTGRPPFRAETPLDTLLQVLEREPERPRALDPRIERDLEIICLKCLQKDPRKRYSNAEALAEELQRFLNGEPIQARSISWGERCVKWAERRPAVAGLAAAVVLLTMVSIGLVTWKWRQALVAEQMANKALGEVLDRESQLEQQKNLATTAAQLATAKAAEAGQAQRDAEAEKENTKKQLLRAETVLCAFQLDSTQRALQDYDLHRAEPLLEDCQWNLRGWEYHYLWSLSRSRVRTLQSPDVSAVALSRDGKLLASAGLIDHQIKIKIWDTASGREYFLLKGHTGLVTSVAFSPDGKRLASASCDRTVRFWDLTAGQEIIPLRGHTEGETGIAFSPDGKRLALTREDETVRVWDATSGREILTIKVHTQGRPSVSFRAVTFSPDGKCLASTGYQTVTLWDSNTGKEILTFGDHTSPISSVAFSPDGKRLASAGGAHQPVRLWDTATGREIPTFKGLTGSASCVAFSPDGQRLASANQNLVTLWDASTGQRVLTLKGDTTQVIGVVFRPDGKRLISASRGGAVRVWDITGSEARILAGHTGVVRIVVFNPDGKRLASAGEDQTVKVWDALTGQLVFDLRGHTHKISDLVFSRDGKRLAAAVWIPETGKGGVKIWDMTTGREMLPVQEHDGKVCNLVFNSDGIGLTVIGWDGTTKLWSAATGKETILTNRTKAPLNGSDLIGAAFSSDGQRLALTYVDHTVRVLDVTNGRETLSLGGYGSHVVMRMDKIEYGRRLAFSPGGQLLAATRWDQLSPHVKVWDAGNGKELLTLRGHTGQVTSVAFSPDGRRLVSASVDQTIKVWDTATGQQMLTLKQHSGRVTAVAFSPDGQRLASSGSDQTVRIWDAALREDEYFLKGHTEQITSIAFRPDGKQLASASWDQTVRLWDILTGREILKLGGNVGQLTCVAFSPDGKHLASAGIHGAVKVWDASTGQEVLTLTGHTGQVTGVAFSPDGRRIVSASADQTIKVWDTATGRQMLTLKQPSGCVTAVAFSPDGKHFASGDSAAVKVWDASTGQEVLTLTGHTDQVTSVAFSPDGQRLASASGGKGRLWDILTGREILALDGNVGCVAFSPDGKHLASTSAFHHFGVPYPGEVKLWDARTGEEILSLQVRRPRALSVAFSPDGQWLASADAGSGAPQENRVFLWEINRRILSARAAMCLERGDPTLIRNGTIEGSEQIGTPAQKPVDRHVRESPPRLGDDKDNKAVPVSGRVIVNGNPLRWAYVEFVPLIGKSQDHVSKAFSRTDTEGNFTLRGDKERGAAVGKYHIRISTSGYESVKRTKAEDLLLSASTVVLGASPQGTGHFTGIAIVAFGSAQAAGTPPREMLPARYNAKSTLTFEVTAGGTKAANFILTSP
jgi:WD40 repeat protein